MNPQSELIVEKIRKVFEALSANENVEQSGKVTYDMFSEVELAYIIPRDGWTIIGARNRAADLVYTILGPHTKTNSQGYLVWDLR